MKVLYAAAECYPYVKVGGLGDVAGSLPKAMYHLGVDIAIALPYYDAIHIPSKEIKKVDKFTFIFRDKEEEVTIYQTIFPQTSIPVFLFKNKKYIFGKSIYPRPFKKEINQFIFFSRAVLKFLKSETHRFDILHVNDWHTSMIVGLLKTEYRVHPVLKQIATVLTIHNLRPQGVTKTSVLDDLELSEDVLPSFAWDAQDQNIDLLLQGIVNADIITTVSPSYAKEIMTAEYGEGLDQVLKAREGRIFGVLNGIDYGIFNPEIDTRINFQYNKDNYSIWKEQNKLFLQSQLKLDINKDMPLLGMVTRLSSQKGVDLVIKNIHRIIRHAQVIILGTGNKEYEKALNNFNHLYPKQFRALIEYNGSLAQQIFAASDCTLVPSDFEPCGLTQLIGMKYGSVPIVRATGGLKDTVEHKKTGFVFLEKNSKSFFSCIKETIETYKNRDEWSKIVIEAMSKDFSWKKSAKEYWKLYQKAIAFKDEKFI